jgi:hypothetical protein
MELSQEQKKEYISKRDKFLKKKGVTSKLILGLKETIKNKEFEIRTLEKGLVSIIPQLEGCDKNQICAECEIKSMKYMGNIPGQGETTQVYDCILWGYRKLAT